MYVYVYVYTSIYILFLGTRAARLTEVTYGLESGASVLKYWRLTFSATPAFCMYMQGAVHADLFKGSWSPCGRVDVRSNRHVDD